MRSRRIVEIHGVRVCGELECRMRYDEPDAVGLFRFCGERGLDGGWRAAEEGPHRFN